MTYRPALLAALVLAACGDEPRPQRGAAPTVQPATPAPAEAIDPPCASGDCDCPHFDSQAEAQAFFERHGPGDRHRLDRDDDGVACEML